MPRSGCASRVCEVDTCERCGHPLGVGRYCLNCGQRTGGEVTDTAERPATREPDAPTAAAPRPPAPVTPPPVLQTPPEPRFPLFADEVARGPMPSGPPPSGPPASPPTGHRAPGTSRPGWLPWAIGAAVLVLVAALGVVLLVTGGDDEEPSARDTTSRSPDPTPTSEAPTPEPTPTPEPEPTTPAEPEDVATRASARVPATAAPNTDVEGNLVRFEARNMLDGVATTCWRMPGDGTGSTITITLDAPTRLTQVGLVNGYAKSSPDGRRTLDWYRGNRRVLVAEWTFDDGTTVEQSFGESRDLQMVDVDAVTSSTITLRLVDVSSPGTGRARRDYTAISDLSLVGTPA
jgi:ribosomal protein L32